MSYRCCWQGSTWRRRGSRRGGSCRRPRARLPDRAKVFSRWPSIFPVIYRVWHELCAWCETYKPREPPASKLGEALGYFTNHKEALGRFLEDGIIPIDNGIVERLHVRTALTRKNFLFAGSNTGGERAAIAYTILGCCRLAGVNPAEYLTGVLPRLAARVRLRDIAALMPARWKATRVQAAVVPAGVTA